MGEFSFAILVLIAALVLESLASVIQSDEETQEATKMRFKITLLGCVGLIAIIIFLL